MHLYSDGFAIDNYINNVAPQKSAIPSKTVPISDLVNKAKRKVGIATKSSGRKNSICRGSPAVINNGRSNALKIAAGIKSSHATSHSGSSLLERKKSGIHLGKNVTSPIPIKIIINSSFIFHFTFLQPFSHDHTRCCSYNRGKWIKIRPFVCCNNFHVINSSNSILLLSNIL